MLIIQGGTIVTMDGSQRVIPNGSLVINDEIIQAVLKPGEPLPDGKHRVIDATGRIVTPGLANMHCCLSHFPLRYSSGKPGSSSAQAGTALADPRAGLSKDGVLYAGLAGIVKQIHAGVSTLFVPHLPVKEARTEMAALADGVSLTGVRACLSTALRDIPDASKGVASLKQAESFMRWCTRERVPNLRVMVGLHRSSTCSDEMLGSAAELADRVKTGIHVEVAATQEDAQECLSNRGIRVVQRLHDFGLLRRETIAARAIHVDENEMEILRHSECLVVHTPSSDLLAGRTTALIAGMLKRGIRLAIGSADQPTSPLSEARLSRMMTPAWTADRPKSGLDPLLRAVFSESARFAGSVFGFRMGSLEEGAAADVATFPAAVTRPLEDWDWAEQIIFGIGSQARADNLIVSGNIVMQNGVIQTIVEEEILAKVRELTFINGPTGI